MQAAELAADAARLRSHGLTIRQIAERQGCSVGAAYKRLQRAVKAVPVEAVEALRAIECERLDAVIARFWDIVGADHPYISHGRVMSIQVGIELREDGTEALDADGKTIPVYERVQDAGPVMAALAGIIRASESKRKLLGLDAPTKAQIHVITEDMVDAELRRLEDEIAATGAGVSG